VPRGLTTGARHAGGGLLRDVLLVLLLFGLGGLVGGALWRWLWTPVRGTAFEGVWYPTTNSSEFSATGLFVLIGLGIGLVLGVLSALVTDRRELLVLGLVVLGSLLATGLMLLVGGLGMPADPTELAATAANGTELPATLTVRGWSPYVAFPTGALVGLCVVFIGVSRKPLEQPHPVDSAG
jgi:hypothetical protein